MPDNTVPAGQRKPGPSIHPSPTESKAKQLKHTTKFKTKKQLNIHAHVCQYPGSCWHPTFGMFVERLREKFALFAQLRFDASVRLSPQFCTHRFLRVPNCLRPSPQCLPCPVFLSLILSAPHLYVKRDWKVCSLIRSRIWVGNWMFLTQHVSASEL